VEVRDGEVLAGERHDGGFVLALAGGHRASARRVLLATGMEYRPPDLPGLAQRWGRSVFHCPFCHGWEVRDRPLAVLERGAAAVHRALLLRMWSDDVTLLTDGPDGLDPEQAEQLGAAGIAIDERPVTGLRGPGDELTAVELGDGTALACEGLLVAATLHQRSGLAAQLGAVAAPPGPLAADAIVVDAHHATPAAGLSAAGDVTGAMPSVANAIAGGAIAAAMIVGSLALEPDRALSVR
jgi:thioredoxin reductase